MGKNSPESTSSTTQTNKDQKQTAGNYALQVAEGANFDFNYEGVSEEEAQIFELVAGLANKAFEGSQAAFKESLNTVVQRYETQESDLKKVKDFVGPLVTAVTVILSIYFIAKNKVIKL